MKLRFQWIFLLFSLGIAACVSPLEIDADLQTALVIRGVLTNSEGLRSIEIGQSQDLNQAIRPIGEVSASIFKDGQEVAEMIEVPGQVGELELPSGFTFERGSSYHVEIITGSDGKVYRSFPQTISEDIPDQSLDWRRGFTTVENSEGLPQEVAGVEILVQIPVEPEQPTRYFRYQMEDVWEFREVPKPSVDTLITVEERFVIGVGIVFDTVKIFTPDTAKVCYLSRTVADYPSLILATDELSSGLARQVVISREIDASFLFQHYFNVYRHSIDERAYEYYQKLERLSQLDGSLYDEIPAAVRGNLYDVADSNRIILGYIELSVADTMRLSLNENDLNQIIRDGCRPGSGENIECPPQIPAPGTGFVTPCQCWDCDIVHGLDKTLKPAYWDD